MLSQCIQRGVNLTWVSLRIAETTRCCGQVTASSEEMARLPVKSEADHEVALSKFSCPRLGDKRCRVYAERPLVCRSFGTTPRRRGPDADRRWGWVRSGSLSARGGLLLSNKLTANAFGASANESWTIAKIHAVHYKSCAIPFSPWRSSNSLQSMRSPHRARGPVRSLEAVANLLDAGRGALIVQLAAGRAADADGADDFFAGADRPAAAQDQETVD